MLLNLIMMIPLVLNTSVALASCDDACAQCRSSKSSACCDAAPTETASQQVELRVTIAEVDRSRLSALGVRLEPDKDRTHCCRTNNELIPLSVETLLPGCFQLSADRTFAFGTIGNALEWSRVLGELTEQGHARTVAQPRLITLSGKPACVTVGGEFPILVPGQEGTFTVEFREYGQRMNFVPTVLGSGRVHLDYRMELSDLDAAHSVVLEGFTVPALKERRVESSVELESGETCVVAALFPGRASSVHHRDSGAVEKQSGGASLEAAADRPEKELVITVSAETLATLGSRQVGHGASTGDVVHADHCSRLPNATLDDLHQLVELVHRLGGELTVDADADEIELEIRLPQDPSSSVIQAGAEWDSDRPHPAAWCSTPKESKDSCRSSCHQCAAALQSKSDVSDEDADDDEQDETARFIEAVLQAQMHYLEQLMHARLQHECELLHAKADADSALARQQTEHAQEMIEARAQHVAELQRMKEAMWQSQRDAIQAQHRQALEHQREVAELRTEHVREIYQSRLAAMESEVRLLRERLGSTEADRVGHAWRHFTSPSAETARTDRRLGDTASSLWVEDLATGRVRYSTGGLEEKIATVSGEKNNQPEQVDFNVLSPAPCPMHTCEVERLRRDVTRLRALVEDLLCIAPDSPPSPVPQELPDEACEEL